MMFKRFFKTLSFIAFLTFSAFAQAQPLSTADLSSKDAQSSWMNVAGGTVIGNPVPTTSGFCFANDGRILTSITEKGAILWQKPLSGKATPYIAVNSDDFVAIVTGSKTLNFINSTGALIWQKQLPFEPTSSPVFGRDERIFIKGKKDFLCLSLKGVEKYNLKMPELKSIPCAFFNDGSILVFFADEKSGKTSGQRITPYGEILEKITFTSIVKNAESIEDGILVALDNGDCALVSVKNGEATTEWVTPIDGSSQVQKSKVAISSYKNDAIFILQDGKVLKTCAINLKTGKTSKIFPLGDGDINSYSNAKSTDQGVFLCDGLYAREFSVDGTIFWEAKIPPKKQWTSAFYTENNYLVLCKTAWIIDAYLMRQTTTKKMVAKKNRKTYNEFLKKYDVSNDNAQFFSPLLKKEELLEIRSALQKGNYAEKEIDWISKLKAEFARYKNASMAARSSTRLSQSYFDADLEYTELLFETAGLFGTSEFTSDIAYFLTSENKTEIRTSILNAAGTMGFDRDLEILDAIQHILATKIRPTDKTQIFLVCDTVYNICAYMGRPALFEKGREILSNFFYPKYDNEVRDYARKTLEKIGELKI